MKRKPDHFLLLWKRRLPLKKSMKRKRLHGKSGWISVFAYTPQRPEMSYTCSPFAASALNSSTGTFSTDAISSINAPVPPAQLPFIRISETLLIWSVSLSLKKIIFASWPPSSIAVPTFSYFFWEITVRKRRYFNSRTSRINDCDRCCFIIKGNVCGQ